MRRTISLLTLVATITMMAACSRTDVGPASPRVDSPAPPQSPTSQFQVPETADPADPGPIDSDPSLWIRPVEGQLVPAGGKLVVDDDGAQCPDAGYTTIQSAVDDAATQGGKQDIEICPGKYAENVTIGPNNPVKLKGSGVDATIVTGVPGTGDPIIDIDMSDEVEIENLTVDGLSDRVGDKVYGILYYDTDGKVKDVAVRNIRNAAGSNRGYGIGIRAGAGGPDGADVKVEKSRVENYTRVGIIVDGDGAKADIKDNVVTGPVGAGSWGPNGIQVSRAAEGKIDKNVVDNNPSPNPPGGAGSGIILTCAGETDVKDNHVTRADIGISLTDQQGAKVHKNLIEDSAFDGISLQFLGDLFGDIGCGITPTAFNEIKDNTIRDAASIGVSFFNFDPATESTNPFENSIEKNSIHDSRHGIVLFDGRDNLLKDNRALNNGGYGMVLLDGPGNLLEKNTIGTTSFEGILIDSADGNAASHNGVEDAGRNGIRVRNTSSTVIDKNKVERSDAHGIRVDQSDDSMLTDNDFKENGRTGIRLFASDDNVVEKNRVDRSGDEGILVFENSEGNLFEKNDVKKSGTLSCDDNSTGGGTASTANTWERNKGEKPSDPVEICEK